MMKPFNYYQPTKIRFGAGRVKEVAEATLEWGKRCLLVTTPVDSFTQAMVERVKKGLIDAGVKVAHFDGVHPNPTTEDITAGAKMAAKHKADVVVGLGGGSAMDGAKAIAVEATHKGSSWDYLFFRETQPTKKTLPIIAVTSTSGTGSHVTQVAVVTNSKERNKSAIYNPIVYPKIAIVDPELMLTIPEHTTAVTGFDVFCHVFESMLHPNASVYTEHLAKKAIRLIAGNLTELLKDLGNLERRTVMAWADTLAGLCIANAGVTLPHGVGMAISGMYPQIAHGEALSIIYPAFTRFTFRYAVPQFAFVGRAFNPDLARVSDDKAAEASCEVIDRFIRSIGMWLKLKDFKMPETEIADLARASMVLPDYKGNPRVATAGEMRELIQQSYGG